MATTRSFSRRNFLAVLGGTVTASILASCGQSGTGGAEAPAKSGEAPKAAAPAAPAAPAAAGTPAADVGKPVTPGVFNVWFSSNWNTVTDEAVGNAFVDWGKQNGVKVEYQAIPGGPQLFAKESAAVAAGQPPEINRTNLIYWYTQGEMPDLRELATKFKDKAGGMYPIALSSQTASDGGLFAASYAIDTWPPHWRTDVIGPATGGRFFETWDELIELGPKVQKPPQTFTIAFSLGHEGDHVNNVVHVLWAYGGRLCDEKGVPDIKNPANKAGIETIVRMWKAKLIPPDSFAQTVTSWNNETYQKGRALSAINPATIMGWLEVNDKELGEKTGLAQNPKGPAGSFAEGQGLGFNYFKKAKMADKAPSALEYFLQPETLLKVSKAVEGRFVPIYRDHSKGEFWEKSKYAELKLIAENGRIREWPANNQPWITDLNSAKFTLSDMINKIVNENMSIEDAQEWAQNDMMDSYNKLVKKA